MLEDIRLDDDLLRGPLAEAAPDRLFLYLRDWSDAWPVHGTDVMHAQPGAHGVEEIAPQLSMAGLGGWQHCGQDTAAGG